jgi:hypothetical protein
MNVTTDKNGEELDNIVNLRKGFIVENAEENKKN